jgi:hypothetical protein
LSLLYWAAGPNGERAHVPEVRAIRGKMASDKITAIDTLLGAALLAA